MFPTKEALLENQVTWNKQIAQLTPEQIKLGMEKVKDEKANGNKDFDWPDIGKTIFLCKGIKAKKTIPPEHRLFKPLDYKSMSEEELDSIEQSKAKIRDMLKKGKSHNAMKQSGLSSDE